MIPLFLTALFLGVISSIPLGVLGAYMINQALEQGFRQGVFIASVGSFLDTIYCFASLLGIYLIIDLPWLRFSLQAAGLLFLIYIGYQLFLRKEDGKNLVASWSARHNITPIHKNSKLNNYLQDGIFVGVYYLFNPIMAAAWINISSVLHSYPLLNKSISNQFLFSLIVGSSGLVISSFFLYLAIKIHKSILSFSTMKIITATLYLLALLFFAFYLARGLAPLL